MCPRLDCLLIKLPPACFRLGFRLPAKPVLLPLMFMPAIVKLPWFWDW